MWENRFRGRFVKAAIKQDIIVLFCSPQTSGLVVYLILLFTIIIWLIKLVKKLKNNSMTVNKVNESVGMTLLGKTTKYNQWIHHS